MKWMLLVLMLNCYNNGSCQAFNRQQLRALYMQSIERRTALDSFMISLGAVKAKTPVEECYYGICHALCIQYTDGNWSKLKLVMKSRGFLNQAVEKDPKDPELRFLRLMLEHFLPSFLGLNKHIADDLHVIFANPDFINDSPDLKKKVIEFLIWTKRCDPAQTSALEKQLAELNKKIAQHGG